LTEMAYQMGGGSLNKFKKMKKALEARDYEKAAKEALDSAWATQTAKRAKTVANQLRSAGSEPVGPPDLRDEEWSRKADRMFGDIPEENDFKKAVKGDEDSQYVVQAGDTLSAIAKRHGLDWQKLAQDNSLADPDKIKPGQVIDLGVGQPPAESDPFAIPGFDKDKPLSEMLGMLPWDDRQEAMKMPEPKYDPYLGDMPRKTSGRRKPI